MTKRVIRPENTKSSALKDEVKPSFPFNSKPVAQSRPDARRWVEKTLKQLDYQTTGELVVVDEDYLGDIWCIDTDRGKVYFKATAPFPLFANEACVSYELTHLFKENVADVIAFDKDRSWQLTRDFGETVGNEQDAEVPELTDIYQLWGGLQCKSVEHLDLLRESGCQARSINNLVEQLYWHIQQPKLAVALNAGGTSLVGDLHAKLEASVKQLKSYSLPNCLVHGDLHDNNVAKKGSSYLFFDWSDACISHPFMEGHIMYRLPDSAEKHVLIKRYLANWCQYLPEDELLQAWKVAEPLCYIHHAVTYASFVLGMPDGFEDSERKCAGSVARYLSLAVNYYEPEPQSVSDLQVLLDRAVSCPAIPGVSAALVQGDRLLWQGAAGFADLERKTAMTVDHMQLIASITKTITAAAVMQQVESGSLKLDQDVNHYLSFSVRNPKFPDIPITIRHLLVHRSSITDGSAFDESYQCGDPVIELAEWVEGYLRPEGRFYSASENFLNWAPGTEDPETPPRTYSNVAFGLLGYLVEVVTGQSFADYCQSALFDVLGMNRARWLIGDPVEHTVPYTYLTESISRDKLDLVAKTVQASTLEQGALIPHCLYSVYNYPDGQICTTPTDLSLFLRACISGGQLHGKRILEEETLKEMFTEQHDGQGLCWFIGSSMSGGRVLMHSGGDYGVSTQMAFRERDGAGAIIFFNCSNPGVQMESILNGMFTLMNKLEKND